MTLRKVDKIIQRCVLAVLYYSKQGENWRHPLNFLSNEDMCEWKGAGSFDDVNGLQGCNIGGPVVDVELWSKNMTIIIPSELELLTELKTLNLLFNKIFGQVPVSLSNILSLTKVNSI